MTLVLVVILSYPSPFQGTGMPSYQVDLPTGLACCWEVQSVTEPQGPVRGLVL